MSGVRDHDPRRAISTRSPPTRNGQRNSRLVVWRSEFGGLKLDQVRQPKEWERENAGLRRAVSDLRLNKMILQEAAVGKHRTPRAVAQRWGA